jgi:hypothetical protein
LPIEKQIRNSIEDSKYMIRTTSGKNLYSCIGHSTDPANFSDERKNALKDLPKIYLEKLDFICYIEAEI